MPAPKLKTLYEKQEEIPEGFGELYVEKNGHFELTGIEGIKTPADVERLQTALVKERNDLKAAKEKLSKFGDFDPEALPALQEELTEAKARLETLTAEGKLDESKVTERINASVAAAVGPLTREKTALERAIETQKKLVADKESEIVNLKSEQKQERIRTRLRDAAVEAKVLPTAVDDAVLVGERMFDFNEDGKLQTKADAGVTPGLDPKEWTKEMMEVRPHWWPASVGGNARGGAGAPASGKDNPWSAEGWSVSRQGQVTRELMGAHGRDVGLAKAAEMATRVGSKIGATKPPPAGARAA